MNYIRRRSKNKKAKEIKQGAKKIGEGEKDIKKTNKKKRKNLNYKIFYFYLIRFINNIQI